MSTTKQTNVSPIPGPVLDKTTLPDGAIRVLTKRVIKGEVTDHDRIETGFKTIEEAKSRRLGGNIIAVGMSELRFSDGTVLFQREVNCWD